MKKDELIDKYTKRILGCVVTTKRYEIYVYRYTLKGLSTCNYDVLPTYIPHELTMLNKKIYAIHMN